MRMSMVTRRRVKRGLCWAVGGYALFLVLSATGWTPSPTDSDPHLGPPDPERRGRAALSDHHPADDVGDVDEREKKNPRGEGDKILKGAEEDGLDRALLPAALDRALQQQPGGPAARKQLSRFEPQHVAVVVEDAAPDTFRRAPLLENQRVFRDLVKYTATHLPPDAVNKVLTKFQQFEALRKTSTKSDQQNNLVHKASDKVLNYQKKKTSGRKAINKVPMDHTFESPLPSHDDSPVEISARRDLAKQLDRQLVAGKTGQGSRRTPLPGDGRGRQGDSQRGERQTENAVRAARRPPAGEERHPQQGGEGMARQGLDEGRSRDSTGMHTDAAETAQSHADETQLPTEDEYWGDETETGGAKQEAVWIAPDSPAAEGLTQNNEDLLVPSLNGEEGEHTEGNVSQAEGLAQENKDSLVLHSKGGGGLRKRAHAQERSSADGLSAAPEEPEAEVDPSPSAVMLNISVSTATANFREVGDVTVYSAFYDDRLAARLIRMVAVGARGRPRSPPDRTLWCVFSPRTAQPAPVSVRQTADCQRGHKYCFHMMHCQVPEGVLFSPLQRNNTVQLVAGRRDDLILTRSDENVRLDVIVNQRHLATSSTTESKTALFSVCVPPLYGELSALQVVEFVELNRLLGAAHFTFYTVRVPREVARVLAFYQQAGVAITLPWSLPAPGDVWERGAGAAAGDCLLRSTRLFPYVVFTRPREVLVPRRVSTWRRLLADLHRDHPALERSAAAYQLLPVQYYARDSQGRPPGQDFEDSLLYSEAAHFLTLASALRSGTGGGERGSGEKLSPDVAKQSVNDDAIKQSDSLRTVTNKQHDTLRSFNDDAKTRSDIFRSVNDDAKKRSDSSKGVNDKKSDDLRSVNDDDKKQRDSLRKVNERDDLMEHKPSSDWSKPTPHTLSRAEGEQRGVMVVVVVVAERVLEVELQGAVTPVLEGSLTHRVDPRQATLHRYARSACDPSQDPYACHSLGQDRTVWRYRRLLVERAKAVLHALHSDL